MGAEARRGAASPPSVQAGAPGAGAPTCCRLPPPSGAFRHQPRPWRLSPEPPVQPQALGPRCLPEGSGCLSGTSPSPPRVSPDSGREVLRLAKKVSEGSPQGLGAL